MKKFISVLLGTALMVQVPCFAYSKENLTKCLGNNPYHILVNKQVGLSKDYKPSNLIMPKVKFLNPGNIEKNYMEYHAAKALEKMFNEANKEGVKLVAVSGYRSYSRQQQLYENAVALRGVNQKGTAKPGESEHQTGLAMDINDINQKFENTKEGKWLAKNAHKYGFIIRYPKGKEKITGYIYEPWHIRYVGNELATYCYENKLTLEEVEHCCIKEKQVHIETFSTENVNEKIIKDYHVIERAGVIYIKAEDLVQCIGGYTTVEQGTLTFYLNGMQLVMQETIGIKESLYVPMRSTLNQLGYSINYTKDKISINL
ncbi:M15 family metallopeptidase [Cellulosilyticum ruminicola]|uniref:M15 family metallopeptidase n=1 Tax=Cellulosilyticum ruminicola TaxID=425254 RepID=UPI0006D28576|nr:M15 family metallopeptidase [Cellulosilyticum ruminicola]